MYLYPIWDSEDFCNIRDSEEFFGINYALKI